ncbi:hypothetical protein G6F70_000198 [Rhizopus microsporus]|nr:hypothetical protein G6F70_000198 [Rhizopus microsporus]KAG1238156.1 hypothetical protein G6F67_000619 [Rhizopus microsporus]
MQHVAESNKDKRDLIKLHIQAIFQDIALRADTKQSMEEAVSKMKEYFLKADVCKASKEKDKEDSTGITIKSIKNEANSISLEKRQKKNKTAEYIDLMMQEVKHW